MKMVLQTKQKHRNLVAVNVNDNEDDKTTQFQTFYLVSFLLLWLL